MKYVKVFLSLRFACSLLLPAYSQDASSGKIMQVRETEYLGLIELSRSFRERYESLTSQSLSLRQNSLNLALELENSKSQIVALQSELEMQKPLLTELGNLLTQSQEQVEILKLRLEDSEKILMSSKESSLALQKEINRLERKARIYKYVAVALGVTSLTLIALK